MSDSTNSANPLFTSPVVLDLPWQGSRRTDLSYGEAGQEFDITYPDSAVAAHPCVLLVTGYSDTGYQAMAGMRLKEIAQSRSWARLLAASGIAAITYATLDPVKDVMQLYEYLEANREQLQLDTSRLGVLSVSGNVPNALHFLQTTNAVRCASFCYGFMQDSAEDKGVSEAAAQFRFALPVSERAELPVQTALLLVRAGRDQFAAINASIDRFVGAALASNRDLEVINYPEGVHAFDILDDSARSQQIVRRILAFFKFRLEAV